MFYHSLILITIPTLLIIHPMFNPVQAETIQLQASLANPSLLVNQQQTTYLRVGLIGIPSQPKEAPPVNVALVIDQSGSMQGEKIQRAKQAAIMAVERLRAQDIIAVVSYDHQANVLLPATKAQDQEVIKNAINQLVAEGQTALFDGVEKGAKEVRKFWQRHQINRIILVSDGLANVGPSTPNELGILGASLRKENMAITTIGLGLDYNEDLMTQLAKKSDGNHAFVENVADLTRIFSQELGDIFSVVAQEVNVTIICTEGVRPRRVFGREAKIQGQTVAVELNQLYSGQEKYILLELDVPPIKQVDKEYTLAGVAVVYRNLDSQASERLSTKITTTFTPSAQLVQEKINATVMATAIEQLAVAKNKLAVELRDAGKIKEAQQLLLENAATLAEEASKYHSKTLEELKNLNLDDATKLDEDKWARQRKSMRREQYRYDNQQKY